MPHPTDDARGRTRLADERTDYLAGTLDDSLLDGSLPGGADPMALFDTWMEAAFARRDEAGDLPEPTAVVLSTVDVTGPAPRPRSRAVLLKAADERGFVIYTNTRSAKGRQLTATPWASLLLPWFPLQRQIRIDGRAEPVDPAEVDAYWASRPRGSQIGSAASEQSAPIADRAALDARFTAAAAELGGADDADGARPIPRPAHWSGFRVVPDRIEFWQGRHGRFHDRIEFTRDLAGGTEVGRYGQAGTDGHGPWRVQRLQP
ncbi:pyridoxamine 5'-phosphate oxidase [Brachybacterium huguangmaarense]